MKIKLIACGKMKGSDYEALESLYSKRLHLAPDITEINIKGIQDPGRLNTRENEQILSLLTHDSYVLALDPLGKQISSPAFSKQLESLKVRGISTCSFIIGGADGLNEAVKERADTLLSFGHMTWPHLLARVMLLEQLYRAQQIANNHPYHKA